MNFNFKQLEAFRAVVEYKNFTKASHALFLIQSTVSAHVKALEKELGRELIIRSSKKNLYITQDGYRVYEYAKKILKQCEEMEREFSDTGEKELLIGASTIPAKYILPKRMASFLTEYPDCRFVLDQGDSDYVLDQLKDGRIRIGFVGTKKEEDNLTFQFLCQDQLVMITQNNERFRGLKESGTMGKELLREPILLRTETSGTRMEIDKYLKEQGIGQNHLHVVAKINDQEIIKNAVMNGMGVNIVSARAVEEEVKAGKLLAFDLEEKKYYRTIYIVYHKEEKFTWLEQKFLSNIFQIDDVVL